MHREITPTRLSGPWFHAPLYNFTPSLSPVGGPLRTTDPDCSIGSSLAAFNVTLLILDLEIPFNFRFDMQCAGNDNSNVNFQVNTSFQQILFPCHTWTRSKGLRTIGSNWPDKRYKTGLVAWPGVGEKFSCGQPPQENSVGSGVVWVMGLLPLCLPSMNVIQQMQLALLNNQIGPQMEKLSNTALVPPLHLDTRADFTNIILY